MSFAGRYVSFPLLGQVGRQEVIAELKRYDFERPVVQLDELTDDVISLLRDYSLP